jgi:ribonuclease HI
VPETTNNRMELQAAIEALKLIKRSLPVDLYTDSEYLRKGMTEWLAGWKRNNWRTAAKQPVKNQDLWEQLDTLATTHKITWHWVRGHNDHPENERADKLATEAIKAQ